MNDTDSHLDELSAMAVAFGLVIVAIVSQIEKWSQEMPDAHRRAARLQAYRRRHQWRKADVPKLRDLGVCAPAERRLQRIESGKGRGRGVIGKYRAPDVLLRAGISYLNAHFDPATPPQTRLAGLKKNASWWPYVVEALYRGEYRTHKDRNEKSPSETAEQAIAHRLGVSSAAVRKICTAVRRERGNSAPDCAALALGDFDRWLQNGGLIWAETIEA